MKDSVAAPGAPVAPLDTVPKLLLRNAVEHADRPAIRHKDFGIWQTWTWARLRDEVRAFAVGLQEARPRARRHGGHRRRQPPAPLCHVRRRAEPRRHSRARLPGLGGRRDGLRARARRGEARRRRGPGAGRQDRLDRRAAAAAAQDRLRRPERPQELRPGQPACLRARPGAGPRGAARPTPAPRAGGSTRSPRARAPTSA